MKQDFKKSELKILISDGFGNGIQGNGLSGNGLSGNGASSNFLKDIIESEIEDIKSELS